MPTSEQAAPPRASLAVPHPSPLPAGGERALPATAFLLAHQDDELGCLPEIDRVLQSGGRAVCIFLTDGAGRGSDADRRNRESLKALARLGVATGDIRFLGSELKIADGALIEHLHEVAAAVHAVLADAAPVRRIVVHAWEGGHPDHDAAHLLGVGAAVSLGILGGSRQFPLYRAARRGPLPYVGLQPLAANGPVEGGTFARPRGLAYLRMAFGYRSQRRAVLALLPFLAWRYLWRPGQQLQPLTLARTTERPHAGRLLYERMGRMSYGHLRARADAYLAGMQGAA
jgi:LmbE family N-acetylglucosaminyl deacetylase